MRKNYMLKLFTVLVIAGVSIGGANAVNPTPTSTTIITENSDNWVEVQNENGIKVYFLETTGTDGVTLLEIKFENVSNNVINFNWSIDKKSQPLFKDVSNRINSSESLKIDSVKILIPINKGESY